MADLHVSVTEDGINGAIALLMRHAPFLFNYAYPTLKPILVRHELLDQPLVVGYEEEWLACHDVPFPPVAGAPRFRRLPPMVLPGMPIELPWCIQVTRLALDLHPGGRIDLPPQLQPPLPEQAFALELELGFGFACIPTHVAVALAREQTTRAARMLHRHRPQILPVKKLLCSKLRVLAVGHLEVETHSLADGSQRDDVRLAVDGLEIVDIRPAGLENALECYLRAMLAGWVLPHLVLALQPIVVKALGVQAVQATLTPGFPDNPAIGQDALRAWLDVAIT